MSEDVEEDQEVVISSIKGQNFEEFSKSIIFQSKENEDDIWKEKLGNESYEMMQEDIIVP